VDPAAETVEPRFRIIRPKERFYARVFGSRYS
jgi:hypothetical protein